MENEISLKNFLHMLQGGNNVENTESINKNIALERLKTLNENDKIKHKQIPTQIKLLNELNNDFHEYSQFQKFKKR